MTRIIVETIKYLLIILFACYSFDGFLALSVRDEKAANRLYFRQTLYLFLIHLAGNLAVFAVMRETKYVLLYLGELFILIFIQSIYNFFYLRASRLLCNHMCMLLAIGFLMLTRLDEDKALRQLLFAAVASLVTFLLPFLIRRLRAYQRFGIFYAVAGIAILAAVSLFGGVEYGANLSISVGAISLQPSEFIKILFVLFAAAMLMEPGTKEIVAATVLAAVHVLILVASHDLGAAFIFFVTYVVMLFVATGKLRYLTAGLLSGAAASVLAYFAFAHVRTRVIAFWDPESVIDGAGYQVAQSLFALGSGGFFGTGLYQGLPESVPVVTKDFIFSAIGEELGVLFAILLILMYASIYLLFLNIAMQITDSFYKLLALGLGTLIGTQVLLNIGGAIKALPSTGVTLPLISYGGSSLFSSFIIFAIIQGLYMAGLPAQTPQQE